MNMISFEENYQNQDNVSTLELWSRKSAKVSTSSEATGPQPHSVTAPRDGEDSIQLTR
jgi:hypothetical protein